ncbi:MAG: 50S ribosomal protein L7ae-like protein [Christensenellaceae bacterium]|nr:50S ribosomal protein L7ae-like protein [Christensenellaceae bacterium]
MRSFTDKTERGCVVELQTNDEILQQLVRAKNKAVGTKKVLKAIDNKIAQRVYLAKDTDSFMYQSVINNAQLANIPVTMVESRVLLGKICGVSVKTAAAAICK